MKFWKSALFGLALIGLSTTASAQLDFSSISAAPAYLSPEKCISLDVSAPVQEFYVMDITVLGFASEADAELACNRDLSNLITLHLDYASNQVYLQIHTDRMPEAHTIQWWNAYVNEYCFSN